MTHVTRKELRPGVFLTAVQTKKFKSALFSVTLLAPLNEAQASSNALVPYILRRGTREHPNLESISAVLDELYGGTLEPMVRKKGETQCIGFAGSFLDEGYTLENEPLLESAARLMGDLLLHPFTTEGGFSPDYFRGERDNLVSRIRAQMNEKRQYSVQQLVRHMCRGEAYGVDKYGTEASARALTPEGVWSAYHTLLNTAQVELYYCGSAEFDRVEKAFLDGFADLPKKGERSAPACVVPSKGKQAEPQVVEEAMDVTQGKLAMGFRTDGITVLSREYPALLVFNAVYGGTTTSKLFMNVREKLSLCYFASSMLEKSKGIMLVSSGIEFDKYQQAREEIMAQLEAVSEGAVEEWELVGAIRSIVSALTAAQDSQGGLEDYWLGQAVTGQTETPAALCDRVEKVTLEDVVSVSKRVSLDTIYFLKGQED